MTDDAENTVQVVAKVPESVRDTAKEKLEYGGLSREIRETLERIAFGEDLNQRSRLERQRDELQSELADLREQRRELDADIETTEQRVSAIDEKLSNLTTREDKYEAKIEGLETRIRSEGQRLWADHTAVKEAATTGGVEPEGVIETLKERNPDIPTYVYQQAFRDPKTWNGLPDSQATLAVDERDEI